MKRLFITLCSALICTSLSATGQDDVANKLFALPIDLTQPGKSLELLSEAQLALAKTQEYFKIGVVSCTEVIAAERNVEILKMAEAIYLSNRGFNLTYSFKRINELFDEEIRYLEARANKSLIDKKEPVIKKIQKALFNINFANSQRDDKLKSKQKELIKKLSSELQELLVPGIDSQALLDELKNCNM